MIRLDPSKRRYDRFRQAFRQRKTDALSIYRDETKDRERAEQPERRRYLRQYVSWLWRYWPTAVLLIVLALVSATLEMVHPLFLKFILDRVLLDSTLSAAERVRLLNLAGGTFLAVIVFGQLLSVAKDYRTRQLNVRVILGLRRALYDKLLHLPLQKLSDMKTGGVISRLTGDVDMTSGLLQMGLISPGVSIIRLLIAMVMLFYLNWRLTLIALAVIPVVMLVSFVVSRRIRPIYRAMRDDAAHVDARVGETFGGVRVVRGFRREKLEERNYTIGRHEIIRKQLFAHRREIALWTAWGLMLASVNLVVVWYGGYLQIHGQATVGAIMAFQWYTLLLLNPVWQIVHSFSELQRSLAAMERVFEVLEMDSDKPDKPNAADAAAHVDEIRFDHVWFEYHEDQPVLRDFDVTIRGGQVVALVGRSGSGKTTVTDMAARFYDPTRGRILLNGRDLRDLRLDSFRSLLGIVRQEVFLFDGSVADNIAYGRPEATESEIREAALLANAHEFIVDLPQGYDSLVGERGVKLSGGQAQRLSIARAILADPRILILDEATSNLDSESEQLIQQSLRNLLGGRTTIMIAHRLSTISEADLILVMDEGRIVERGTHVELMKRNGIYHEMVSRQQESMQYE